MSDNIAIRVENLTKSYKLYDSPIDRMKEALHWRGKKYHKDFYALKNISFEIKKGETVGIIGKNGAGKSTLLKIITGVLSPSSGMVTVNGRISALLELGAGFNPEYTGIENIYFQGNLMGYSEDEMESKLTKILEFADIGDFIQQPVKIYSSGMFARLAFAVAINVEPDILIVDESLSVGDMNFQAKCMTAMDNIKKRGTTILFVSHDIGGVKSLCQSGIYIKDGVLVSVGNVSDVVDFYIREMRGALNEEYKKYLREPKVFNSLNTSTQNLPKENYENGVSEFKHSELFNKKVAHFRYGSGEAKITFVEMLDCNGEPVIEAEFNQEVTVRIHVKSNIDQKITVNLQVLDDKKINITGVDFFTANHGLLAVKAGDTFIVEYIIKLPLQEGLYTLNTAITTPIVFNETAKFIDVVPDSHVFKMTARPDARIWSKVFLFPQIRIIKLQLC